MSSKHIKTRTPTDADLRFDPGIGTSKGTTMAGEDPVEIARENTVEGDVENETNQHGGVDENHIGRHNK